MSGRGRAPKLHRRNKSDKPIRGEWRAADGIGWQHGPIPAPPDGLRRATVRAWETWFRAWFAAHWTPGDLPGLRITVRLFDELSCGRWSVAREWRMWANDYGITPAGQQERRWLRARAPEGIPSPYAHLRVVS
jgi:hypothetical protein